MSVLRGAEEGWKFSAKREKSCVWLKIKDARRGFCADEVKSLFPEVLTVPH